jgi:hypothetical protein
VCLNRLFAIAKDHDVEKDKKMLFEQLRAWVERVGVILDDLETVRTLVFYLFIYLFLSVHICSPIHIAVSICGMTGT